MSPELDPQRIRKALARLNDVSDPYPIPSREWEPCVQTAIAALEFTRKVQLALQYCGESDERFARVVKLTMLIQESTMPCEMALERCHDTSRRDALVVHYAKIIEDELSK